MWVLLRKLSSYFFSGGNPTVSFYFCCVGFRIFCFIIIFSIVVFLFIIFMDVFASSIVGVLIVLQITEIFRSILKGYIIYFSNCSTFHVGLCYDKCIDIDSFGARSKATYRLLVQNVECICFLLNLDLIYFFNL